ncbi:UpxY family transcription antiterminator [Acidobacteria bacterium AB60]|nr:UpxY family transcription antiterminator [Acidobacteria bacterium AB60]
MQIGFKPERQLSRCGSDPRNWYAVFTVPQNEKSVARHLRLRQVEHFLPTYEETRTWKNRQRVKVVLPLFPTYVFARISLAERARVLAAPGVLRIVGTSREPIPLPDEEIEFLRSAKTEPYRELIVGQRVRVRSGVMRGVEGVLVRKNNSSRFVITLELINQHAAVELSAVELEPLVA